MTDELAAPTPTTPEEVTELVPSRAGAVILGVALGVGLGFGVAIVLARIGNAQSRPVEVPIDLGTVTANLAPVDPVEFTEVDDLEAAYAVPGDPPEPESTPLEVPGDPAP